MVTPDSTQVIDPEFAFYAPMGYDIGAFLGNLILAYFAQDGHADQANDRKVCITVLWPFNLAGTYFYFNTSRYIQFFNKYFRTEGIVEYDMLFCGRPFMF